MAVATATPTRPIGVVKIAKDLADALVIIAKSRDQRVDEVLDDMFRAKIVAAYPKACKQLEKAAPLPGHAIELGEAGA